MYQYIINYRLSKNNVLYDKYMNNNEQIISVLLIIIMNEKK